MYKKNIAIVLSLVFLLGLFFQYNRSDGFIRLIKNKNVSAISGDFSLGKEEQKNIPRERMLLVYDPSSVHSLFLRHNIEHLAKYLKKEIVAVPAKEALSENLDYDGIIIALENLDDFNDMEKVNQYASQGGNVYFMIRPIPGVKINEVYHDLGISRMGDIVNTKGIKMNTNLLIGAKGFELNNDIYTTSAIKCELTNEANIHMSSQEGIPLLWETSIGKGKYIVYNGSGLGDKMNRGLMTAMIGLGKSVYLYPVAAIKLSFIDDFPAPIPEGYYDKIYDEFKLSTPQFYRQVWWPYMLSLAEKYDIKYTGLIIETYNDAIVPPFNPDIETPDKNNLIIYGRELLKSGGELGIHGYNHQSLAPEGYNQKALGYKPWQSQKDMILSLTELKRYVENVYPDYKIKAYVPPSNILSPEGKQALIQVFPDLKMICSLYTGQAEEREAYIQDFEKSPDGILELPRVSSGYMRNDQFDWETINVINFIGVFSHFVHPDQIFYEESQGLTWREMSEDFESLMKEIQENYGWLRSSTASQGAEYLEEYFNVDYRIVEKPDEMTIYCWGYKKESYFIMKTTKKIIRYEGCQVEHIDDNAYLVKISQPEVKLKFESEGKP